MRAIRCHQFGPPESLTIDDVPSPEPGPGEVRVDIHATGLNFPDVLMIEGKYQSLPPFPFSPGGEYAGVVSAVGDGVTQWQLGDRVQAGGGTGGFAEQAIVQAERLRGVPDGLDLVTASAVTTTYGTSWYALKQRGALKAGETLLVTGAAGGVGLAAVELGKMVGAKVIAAASSDEKLAVARDAGADELVNYGDNDAAVLKERVKELTGGKGVDVVYDAVGGDLFEACLRCMAWEGRLLVIGFVGGDIPRPPMNLVLLKGCQIVGVFYGSWTMRDPAGNAENLRELAGWFGDGTLQPHVGDVFAFEDYAAALNCLKERRARGKVVLQVRPGAA